MISKNEIKNPLDELFDIDSSETEIIEYEAASEVITPENTEVKKDQDDIDVDQKIDDVYDHAVNTFQNQMAYTELIEPRYAARNAEVAATYLNIALQAAAAKARIKTDRKRVNTFIPNAQGKTINNTIVATREEIMKMISVDAEVKELK